MKSLMKSLASLQEIDPELKIMALISNDFEISSDEEFIFMNSLTEVCTNHYWVHREGFDSNPCYLCSHFRAKHLRYKCSKYALEAYLFCLKMTNMIE